MMSEEEVKVIRMVYNRFMDMDSDKAVPTWTDLDDNLEIVDYLTDSELVVECEIKYESHSGGIFRCSQNHPQTQCFAPFILEAVEYILDLYGETEELHVNNRYILCFYLAMSELRLIYSDQ
jgi:hypothetical protein